MTEQPNISKIQRFSLDDGDGIRTTVFLKGCPLSCVWCHNPESKSPQKTLSYIRSNCINCRKCESVCEYGVHRFEDNGFHKVVYNACRHCEKCVKVCQKSCLDIIGEKMTAEEIMEIVRKDKAYYKDNGGLTISGGEPLTYPVFVLELVKLAKQNKINVAIETSGFSPMETIENLLPYVDQWLFDYKAGSPQKHLELCGKDNKQIFNNFELIAKSGCNIRIRYPFINGINNAEEDFNILIKLIKKTGRKIPIQIMPYHIMGISKAENIGVSYDERLPKYNMHENTVTQAKDSLKRLGGCVL